MTQMVLKKERNIQDLKDCGNFKEKIINLEKYGFLSRDF